MNFIVDLGSSLAKLASYLVSIGVLLYVMNFPARWWAEQHFNIAELKPNYSVHGAKFKLGLLVAYTTTLIFLFNSVWNYPGFFTASVPPLAPYEFRLELFQRFVWSVVFGVIVAELSVWAYAHQIRSEEAIAKEKKK